MTWKTCSFRGLITRTNDFWWVTSLKIEIIFLKPEKSCFWLLKFNILIFDGFKIQAFDFLKFISFQRIVIDFPSLTSSWFSNIHVHFEVSKFEVSIFFSELLIFSAQQSAFWILKIRTYDFFSSSALELQILISLCSGAFGN